MQRAKTNLHPHNSTKHRFDAVIFDLDGTLVEFKFDIKASRRAMIAWLCSQGFSVDGLTDETKTKYIYDEADHQCNDNGAGNLAAVRKHLSSILDSFEFRAFEEAKAFPESIGVLQRLNDRGVICALVTNGGRAPASQVLSKFGFDKYLSSVITRDEVRSLKPDPEGVLKTLSFLKIRADQAVFVGDSTIDIEAAKKAGVLSVALANGMYRPGPLAARAPDYLIAGIGDVEKIVFGEDI